MCLFMPALSITLPPPSHPTLALTPSVMTQGFFQLKHHKTVLPALAASMLASSKNPMRVRCHAAMALHTFCAPNKCPAKVIGKHLDAVLAGIVELLQSG